MQSMDDSRPAGDGWGEAVPWNRRAQWVERAALCLSLLYLCMHTLPQAWKTLNTDFPNYYMLSLIHI